MLWAMCMAMLKPRPLLAAPGIDILTTMRRQAYDFMSGSSLAAEHVSGIAALLLQVEPLLSPAQMHELLRATARHVKGTPSMSSTTIGQVDACTALEQLLGWPVCP
jgi:subtilisin family serine protease